MPSNNNIIVRPTEPEVLIDALGNIIDIPEKVKKPTAAESRKAKKARMAANKKGKNGDDDEDNS